MKKIIKVFLLLAFLFSAAAFQTSCSENRRNDGPVIEEGYVRHVILWTLSDELSQEEKQEFISYAESTMEMFEKEFPDLVKADVVSAKRLDSSNCDFMFDMYFKSRKALEDFSTNPEHLAVVAKMKPYITGRTCLDIEL